MTIGVTAPPEISVPAPLEVSFGTASVLMAFARKIAGGTRPLTHASAQKNSSLT